MLCVIWLFPIGFTACSKDSLWCSTAYWITESSGKWGTALIILAASFLFIIWLQEKKGITFLKSILAFSILLGTFAFVNENVTKKILKLPLPCQTYMASQCGTAVKMDSICSLGESVRKSFFEQLVKSNPSGFNNIDQKVLNHWMQEAGYSFPSGHSFNAFLLACILAFSMYESKNKIAKQLYILPFFWAATVCVSRVAIGAHSPVDVSFGAGLGLLIAELCLYFDYSRKLILHKQTQ